MRFDDAPDPTDADLDQAIEAARARRVESDSGFSDEIEEALVLIATAPTGEQDALADRVRQLRATELE